MNSEHKLHPIQIDGIKIKELFIRNNSSSGTVEAREGKFKFKVAHGKFDVELSSVNVALIIEMGTPELPEAKSEEPLDLRVHILAKFSVDKEQFPIDKIEHWAEYNAPMILYPYAREHVYSLSGRVLDTPILLPLLQVPTLKI
ncbi:hypothetical protein PY479_15200 [Shewanella sp. A32]|uniref:hypothetical protein n=1 Tax=Shewanella sp. A32 TaxID=3031327 RepID=UPI0023B90F5E|nr:hypothetical protein [Shewanella sp. A32]MDF0535619.1 hypothetical protein [Shewanella sp. A32]